MKDDNDLSAGFKAALSYESNNALAGDVAGLARLTTRGAKTLTRPGRHADGGNLYLKVSKAGGRSWTFFYILNGHQHEVGLGSTNALTLDAAREMAAEYRRLLALGVDPLAVKQGAKQAAKQGNGPDKALCPRGVYSERAIRWRTA